MKNEIVIYQSPNANSNLQTLLQASRYSTNEIDSETISQDSRDSIKQFKKRKR